MYKEMKYTSKTDEIYSFMNTMIGVEWHFTIIEDLGITPQVVILLETWFSQNFKGSINGYPLHRV